MLYGPCSDFIDMLRHLIYKLLYYYYYYYLFIVIVVVIIIVIIASWPLLEI